MCDGNLCEGSEGKFVPHAGSSCGLHAGDCIFDHHALQSTATNVRFQYAGFGVLVRNRNTEHPRSIMPRILVFYTSCGGNPRLSAAARKASGAGFNLSNKSAAMIASKLRVMEAVSDDTKRNSKITTRLWVFHLKVLGQWHGIPLNILEQSSHQVGYCNNCLESVNLKQTSRKIRHLANKGE